MRFKVEFLNDLGLVRSEYSYGSWNEAQQAIKNALTKSDISSVNVYIDKE